MPVLDSTAVGQGEGHRNSEPFTRWRKSNHNSAVVSAFCIVRAAEKRQRARGLAHSKASPNPRQRLGVRQSSAAFVLDRSAFARAAVVSALCIIWAAKSARGLAHSKSFAYSVRASW